MDVIEQEIHVAFRYPVHFTTGLFTGSNRLLRDLVAGTADTSPARLVVVLDRGVQRAHPTLLDSIERYGAQHADCIALATPIVVLPGGEQVKNDPSHTEQVL